MLNWQVSIIHIVKKPQQNKTKNKTKTPKGSRYGPFLTQVVACVVTINCSSCLGGSQFLTKSDLGLHFYDLGRQE